MSRHDKKNTHLSTYVKIFRTCINLFAKATTLHTNVGQKAPYHTFLLLHNIEYTHSIEYFSCRDLIMTFASL